MHFDHNLSETSKFATEGPQGCVLHFTHGPPNKPEELKRIQVTVSCPVVACDGAGSRARYAMRRCGLTDFQEDLLTRGYKEVLFPCPAEGQDFGATGDHGGEACPGDRGLHIWPRGDHMLMALANRDGSFTGTIYMDSNGAEDSFEALEDADKCNAFCEKHYGNALPHVGGLEALTKQVVNNPNGLLGTVCTDTWAAQAKVLLIGDASHAMVPFFGQGCNCGFEDALWLSRLIDQHCGGEGGKVDPTRCTPQNYSAAFKELEQMRKPNADAICAMALENFVEMRDKTADRKFQAMKRVENDLEQRFPKKFRSRYAMVCYGGDGEVSYANAKYLGTVQDRILQELCEHMTVAAEGVEGNIDDEEGMASQISKVDIALAEKLIDEQLVPELNKLGMDLTTVRH